MHSTKPTVLIVEDDCLLLLDARIALEDAGYAVVEASDAASALAAFDACSHIAAVISDIHMPGATDGVDLARIIRARRPDIPMILTSGNRLHAGVPDGVELVTKPYRSTHLVDRLRAPTAL